MLVLGIESTCDETAASLVVDGKHILSQSIASQIDLHDIYGGVVPELACRRHIDTILPVIKECLTLGDKRLDEVDLIAVANGPGLIGALLIGLQVAKGLAFALDKPLVGVNHIEAHLYASIMSNPQQIQFPALGVVLSGGHTALVLMRDVGNYEMIGQTVDDAIGEAFDKVAKLLSLPYPGGPVVEKLAQTGNANRFKFKAGQVKTNRFDFSFSGLKTAVMYAIKGISEEDASFKNDLSASFQKTAFQDVQNKVLSAAKTYQCQHVIFGGGVTNNRYLRNLFAKQPVNSYFPQFDLTLDNAAMIAGLGYQVFINQGPADTLNLEAQTRLSLVR
ncbi:tRNA N6-adenosine threonylcarbamoyltransferase [Chlamydiales bacterium STE3]|nr:tRNA N6-adenosine threonylcarbamoyltransferase [Chlamydiales bacterium STE3]